VARLALIQKWINRQAAEDAKTEKSLKLGLLPLASSARWRFQFLRRALEHPLSQADVDQLEKLIPRDAIAGTRYDRTQMAHLDSER